MKKKFEDQAIRTLEDYNAWREIQRIKIKAEILNEFCDKLKRKFKKIFIIENNYRTICRIINKLRDKTLEGEKGK